MQGGVTHVVIVACPHPLSCCIYTSLIPCLAAYTLHLFLYFLALSSLHLQHFNGNVLLSCFTGFSVYRKSCMPCYGLPTAPFRRSVLFNMLRLCIGVSAQSIASARIDLCAQNKNGVQQGGSTVGVALSCAF